MKDQLKKIAQAVTKIQKHGPRRPVLVKKGSGHYAVRFTEC